jgi:hypothetical protein
MVHEQAIALKYSIPSMNSVPQPAMKPEDRGVISDRIIGIFH